MTSSDKTKGNETPYCLGTRPYTRVVKLAQKADWLRHEATFSEEHLEKSHHFGYSTASQAAEIARSQRQTNAAHTFQFALPQPAPAG